MSYTFTVANIENSEGWQLFLKMGTTIFKMLFCRAYTDIKSSDLIGEKQLP